MTETVTRVVSQPAALPLPEPGSVQQPLLAALPASQQRTETQRGLDSFETLKSYLRKFRGEKPRRGPIVVAENKKAVVENEQSRLITNRAALFGSRNFIKEKISQINNIATTQNRVVVDPTPSFPLPAEPGTEAGEPGAGREESTVVTVYISGRVPGEYTTSLQTVAVAGRERRAVEEVQHTAPPNWDLIQSSFSGLGSGPGVERASQPDCSLTTTTTTTTTTVTVTRPVCPL